VRYEGVGLAVDRSLQDQFVLRIGELRAPADTSYGMFRPRGMADTAGDRKRLETSSRLLDLCRGKIRKAEVEVTQIVQSLEQAADDAE